jgi:charged multivesicular body protein 2A
MLSFLFAPKQTPKEMLKECQRSIRSAVRDIENAQSELIEKEHIRQIEIKAYAAKGQIPTARIMAKDLVRMRKSIAKFYSIKAQLESVSINLITMQSTEAMAGAMRGAALSMQRMNNTQSLPALQKIIQTFAKEQSKLDMKQDVMNDAMDDAFEHDEADEDAVVNQVLDEIGIGVAERLGTAPTSQQVPVASAASGLTPDLAKRLDNLRK